MNTSQLFALAPWVVLIPVIALLINLIVSGRLGEKFAGILASSAAALSFVVSILLAIALGSDPMGSTISLGTWINIGNLSIDWAFRVDTLSVMMGRVVSGVGTLIHIYSIAYMHADVRLNGDLKRYTRFFVFMNLFIASMMLLVSADNFLMMFVGWEGVGLCSYLLIGFWFEKGKDGTANAAAGKKAFITNRIGDFGFLVAIFLIYWNFGSLQFDKVFSMAPMVATAMPGAALAITLFMLLGVTGKSAQLPLHVWLPDAMAGPTPVSALIHAATMVTAGVYLVARSAPIFSQVPGGQTAVTWVGTITALFAATIALGQNDIKKVLAYSTISQIGYMVAAVGMGAYVAAMFHLITHAFFKGLLFLAAGSVIQAVERGEEAAHSEEIDPQDMRQMGGLRKRLPLTFWTYLIGGLSLAAIAPLAGFFSKDEIVAYASANHAAVFWILLIAAFFTALYVGRQISMVFLGSPRSKAAGHATESSPTITVPLVILAVLAAFGGVLNLPGLQWLETWLAHTFGTVAPSQFVWLVALGSLALGLVGLAIGWLIYGRTPVKVGKPDPLKKPLGFIFTGMQNKWFVDEIYNFLIITPFNALAQFFAGPIDLGSIDRVANGLASGTQAVAGGIRKFENGFVRSYAFWMLLGLAAIMTYFILR